MGVPLTSLVAGGMLNDVDAVVVGAKYEMWDYNGKQPNKVPAAHLSIKIDEDVREQYYTIGDAKDWTVIDNGKRVDSKKSGFNKQSNWGQFLRALVEALGNQKLGTEFLTDDISCLIGLDAHFVQVTGAKIAQKNDEREKTVAVIDVVNALPGQKKTGGGAAISSEDESVAIEVIKGIVTEAGGSGLARASLAGKIFLALKTDAALRNTVSKLASNDAFLKANFNMAGGMITNK